MKREEYFVVLLEELFSTNKKSLEELYEQSKFFSKEELTDRLREAIRYSNLLGIRPYPELLSKFLVKDQEYKEIDPLKVFLLS